MRLYKVKAHPDAKLDRLEVRAPDAYEIWTREPAENGRANAAVLGMLAAHLGLPAKRLRVLKGARSPAKIVAVLGEY